MLPPYGMPDPELNTAPSSPSSTPEPAEKMHPPMHPWQTVLLCLCTASFYSAFSMYRHARDLSIVDTQPRKRWLWFLGTALLFPLLFALPRLFGRIDIVTGEKRWKKYAVLIFVVMIVTAVLPEILGETKYGFWPTIVCLVIYCVTYGYIQAASNSLKNELPDDAFTSRPYAYTVEQWLAIGCGGLCIALVAAVPFLPTFLEAEKLDTFPDQGVYTNEEFGFSLTLHGEGWYRIPTGTFSDGDAAVEFNGRTPDHRLIVFVVGREASVKESIRLRLREVRDESDDIECSDTRTIDATNMTLIGTLDCKGTTLVINELRQFHQFKEIGDYRIEAWARMAATSEIMQRDEADLIATASSLQALPAQPAATADDGSASK